MTHKKLNIGLIGSGFMGQAHAAAFVRAGLLYRDFPLQPVLHTLADANDEIAAAAQRFGFANFTGDWRTLLTGSDIDLVDITTPSAMRFDMEMAVIDAGTEGTIIMDGEQFNELKVARCSEPKHDRGFKTLLAGSQVEQFNGFFGFDFAGGELGYFDGKVIEVHDLAQGIAGRGECFQDFSFIFENQRIIAAMEKSATDNRRITIGETL